MEVKGPLDPHWPMSPDPASHLDHIHLLCDQPSSDVAAAPLGRGSTPLRAVSIVWMGNHHKGILC
jgi:hypothetical protein